MYSRHYTLFLDESITHDGGQINQVFSMAGVIVEKSNYGRIQAELNALKRAIWSDKTDPESIILHQVDVFNGQRKKTKKPEYKRFRNRPLAQDLYKRMGSIFDTGLMRIVGASIKIDEMEKYFCQNGMVADKYLIAFQLLMENYCHFLCKNNGDGDIVYESREDNNDEILRNRFYNIKFMGSMYVPMETMKRIITIQFKHKEENNSGLQIADFVPNCFARDHSGKKPQPINIDSKLRIYRYDGGGLNLRERFGVKYMP